MLNLFRIVHSGGTQTKRPPLRAVFLDKLDCRLRLLLRLLFASCVIDQSHKAPNKYGRSELISRYRMRNSGAPRSECVGHVAQTYAGTGTLRPASATLGSRDKRARKFLVLNRVGDASNSTVARHSRPQANRWAELNPRARVRLKSPTSVPFQMDQLPKLIEQAAMRYQPCFAARLGGVSGGKETQG
jgi:hypothetical protein